MVLVMTSNYMCYMRKWNHDLLRWWKVEQWKSGTVE